jgi:hypothetical protein
MKYLPLFHCNNGYTNAPQCYVIRTLSIFVKRLAVSNEEWQADGYVMYRRGCNRNSNTALDDTKIQS